MELSIVRGALLAFAFAVLARSCSTSSEFPRAQRSEHELRGRTFRVGFFRFGRESNGMNLWLVPVDERSFQRTLAEPCDLSDWPDRPDSFPESPRVWGVRTDREQGSWARNRRNLERMGRGDPVLVYRNSTSRYAATGRIGPITCTEYIRDEYWDGGPALDVYVVENYDDSIDIDPETVNRLLGYKETFGLKASGA